MAKSLVSLTVDDSSFNAKLKKAADSMKQFGQQLVNAAQAQTKLNAVMKANLYAMAATAAVEVGTALYKWASGAYEAEAAQKKLNAEIQQTKLAIDNMVNDLDFDTRIAKAAGKSVDEILKIRKAAAQARLDLADQNYDRVTALGSKATAEQIAEAVKMQKEAWANMKKVMDDATINDVQRRNGTGPYRQRGGGGSSASLTTYAADSIAAQEAELARVTKAWKEATAAEREYWKLEMDSAKAVLDTMKGGGSNKLGPMGEIQSGLNIGNVLGGRLQLPQKLDLKVHIPEKDSFSKQFAESVNYMSQMTGGIGSIASGIEQMGIELPEGLRNVLGGIQGMVSILSGISSILTAISVTSSIPFFRSGGIVPHAADGWRVPGHDYADRTPVLVSSGELILNKAQQGNLASQLSGGIGNLNLTAEVDAEKIIFAVNNRGKRTGRGEMVTSKSRRHG